MVVMPLLVAKQETHFYKYHSSHNAVFQTSNNSKINICIMTIVMLGYIYESFFNAPQTEFWRLYDSNSLHVSGLLQSYRQNNKIDIIIVILL